MQAVNKRIQNLTLYDDSISYYSEILLSNYPLLEQRVSRHFKLWEFLLGVRPHVLNERNCEVFFTSVPDTYLLRLIHVAGRLETIRNSYKKPIYITSGYRCPEVNDYAGGVRNSCHMKCMSVDLKYTPELVHAIDELVRLKKISFGEYIVKPSKHYIHLTFNNV